MDTGIVIYRSKYGSAKNLPTGLQKKPDFAAPRHQNAALTNQNLGWKHPHPATQLFSAAAFMPLELQGCRCCEKIILNCAQKNLPCSASVRPPTTKRHLRKSGHTI